MNATTKVGVNRREDLSALEARIQSAMIPVPPRAEYVRELKRRLSNENDLEIALPKPEGWLSFVWPAAGLLSGTLILVLGVRAVINLLNSRGILQQLKNPAPAHPAV